MRRLDRRGWHFAANAVLWRLHSHDSESGLPRMRSPLWQKLFLAFAALSVSALLTLSILQQRAFERDFLDYVNRISVGRLESAAVQLGRRYRQVGDWGFVERQPRVFESFLDGGDGFPPPGQRGRDEGTPPPAFRDQPRDERPPRGEPGDPRGPGGFPPRDRPPPPPMDDAGPESRRPYEKGPPRKKIDALNIGSRVALVDADGRHVIGNPAVPRDAPFIAVKSDGEIVGKLLLAPLPALQSDADVAFAAAQTRHALIAGVGVLAGALLLAWVLARWLLAPVKALGAGSQKLAEGDYSVRIAVSRGDELGDLARDFNRLAEALERNRQARRDWGADIAHELRTPLAILRGEIQALQDGVRALDQAALASLQAECARLTGLVDDLYQLALADAGALEYKFVPLALDRVIEEVAAEYRGALTAAGLTLSVAPLPVRAATVRADERRLAQLFGNLLTNALRYTDTPGTVRIELETSSDWCRVHVDDSPPGVPAALMPKLFDRLFRVEASRARNAGGAGLGLAICKNIAEAHGGRIEAGNSPLGGLRITVTLPFTRGKP